MPNELIRFQATGKSVRGAIGNVRTRTPSGCGRPTAGTVVIVDGDVVLAGALGSVGQKVVAKQAAKVTAEFAENLQRALGGETVALSPARARHRSLRRATGAGPPQVGAGVRSEPARPTSRAVDPWSQVAAALSAVSAVLSIIVLLRTPEALEMSGLDASPAPSPARADERAERDRHARGERHARSPSRCRPA